ncbi:MAG: PHP domain-containing protein [Candidatus Omnitrophota bacterium]
MCSKFADLHIHTYYSDGTFSPSEVVAQAAKCGLATIAITDHDTVEGIDLARSAAGDCEVLTGIELTAEFDGKEIHILGYLLDHRDVAFLNMLKEMRQVRVMRIHEMCKKLKKCGLNLEPDDVFSLTKGGSVGRLHLARAMFEKGLVFSIADAFARFIGDRGPAYVGKFKMSPKEAIAWIKKTKGIPVLAHPYTISDRSLIIDFVKAGIMGIEAYYPEHSSYQADEFMKIAKKYDLLITGGSDCHGEAKSEVHLGKVKLPYEYVEKLKQAQCTLT